MLAVLLACTALGCDSKEEEKRPPGAGRSDIFGSAPAPSDAGPRAPTDAGIGASLDASAPDSCANPDGGTNCPMLGLMKGEIATAFAAKKSAALATSLEGLSAHAPASYANWASIAKDGAAAARAGEWNAVKASCRGCHAQYKEKYIAEHRGEALDAKGRDGGP